MEIFFFVLLGILKFLFRLTYAFVSIIFSSHVREKGRRFLKIWLLFQHIWPRLLHPGVVELQVDFHNLDVSYHRNILFENAYCKSPKKENIAILLKFKKIVVEFCFRQLGEELYKHVNETPSPQKDSSQSEHGDNEIF